MFTEKKMISANEIHNTHEVREVISFLSQRAYRENMVIYEKGMEEISKVRQCCNHNGTKLTKVHENNTKTQQKQQKHNQCHKMSFIMKVCSPYNLTKKTIKGCYAWANPEAGSGPLVPRPRKSLVAIGFFRILVRTHPNKQSDPSGPIAS